MPPPEHFVGDGVDMHVGSGRCRQVIRDAGDFGVHREQSGHIPALAGLEKRSARGPVGRGHGGQQSTLAQLAGEYETVGTRSVRDRHPE